MADTYSWASNGDGLKAYLGITDASEDERLECWFDAVVELGDLYLGNPFTDDDDVDIVHPKGVLLGIYEFVNILRQQADIKFGIGSVKEGDVQINYGLTLIRDYFQSPLPPNVRLFWFPYKKGLLR